VLAGRKIALFEGTLGSETTLALQIELFAFTAAKFANWT
jgi:hypothetical protein